jgi:processive 1,2-diacylglycerol beta-glucosyltransferase
MNYNKKKILEEFELKENKKTLLFFFGGEGGFGNSNSYKILITIIENNKNVQIVAVAGKNEKAQEKVESYILENNASENIKLLSYTNKVAELMSISDLVITKAGGLTITESLASGLPIAIINPIPGQETENAVYLEEKEVGIWIRKNDNINEALNGLLESETKLRNMKINAKLLAKKNATKEICNTLLKDI